MTNKLSKVKESYKLIIAIKSNFVLIFLKSAIGGFKSATFRRRAAEPSIAEPNETVAVSASISPIPIDIDHNDSVEEIW